jgi:hypothetical protein
VEKMFCLSIRRTFLRAVIVLACLSSAAQKQNESILHPFKAWGLLQNDLEKLDLYMGFTNGFFSGPRSPKFIALADCIEQHMTSEQATAMIDKYYKDNPQRWGKPLGQEIIAALIVKDGPCPGKDPWSK